MKLIRFTKKVFQVLLRFWIKKISYVNVNLYTKIYSNHLKKYGMDIEDFPRYIAPSVNFDGSDYSIIHLGGDCVLSSEVQLLTHDYSIARGLQAIGKNNSIKYKDELFLNGIYIGKNSFIGARSLLLPGTRIGDDVIVGAGSVVKGNVPNNSIVMGNPAKFFAKTTEWAEKKFEESRYFIEE